jgi:hypothetical protein
VGVKGLKAATQVRQVEIVGQLREEVPLKKALVDSRLSYQVTRTFPPEGWLRIRGSRFELSEYMTPAQIKAQWNRQQAAKRKDKRNKGRGTTPLKIRVLKSEGRREFRNYFVNKGGKSGKWHVMSKRYPEDRTSHEIRYGPPITDQYKKFEREFSNLEAIRFEGELTRVLKVKVPL